MRRRRGWESLSMVLKHKTVFFWVVLGLFWGVSPYAWAVAIPPQPGSYIVDLAGIVDSVTERKLNQHLKELEQKTTAQLVVLTVDSLDGEAIEAFSIRIAHEQWKLGQRGKDNGVLLLIALKDRKYRIEVGYGLEGVLPDSLVGSIGRDLLEPFFKKGDSSGGVYAAAIGLADAVAKDAGVSIAGMPKVKKAVKKTRPRSLLSRIFSGAIFIFLLLVFLKNPRAFLLFFLFSSMGGGRRSWGSRHGSGFGGGGFGSFGGGGGFGGGGASGGW